MSPDSAGARPISTHAIDRDRGHTAFVVSNSTLAGAERCRAGRNGNSGPGCDAPASAAPVANRARKTESEGYAVGAHPSGRWVADEGAHSRQFRLRLVCGHRLVEAMLGDGGLCAVCHDLLDLGEMKRGLIDVQLASRQVHEAGTLRDALLTDVIWRPPPCSNRETPRVRRKVGQPRRAWCHTIGSACSSSSRISRPACVRSSSRMA